MKSKDVDSPTLKNQLNRRMDLKNSDWTSVIYQKYTRPRDANGNPFTLFILYNIKGEIVKGVECRNSCLYGSSDELKSLGVLPELSLSPSEYNRLRGDVFGLILSD